MVYRRDHQSGHLSPVQVLRNGLNGAIGIRLSPDQRYAVAIAYRAKAVILYKRDLESGQLEPLHVLKQGDGVHGLSWMPRVRFSPDARQVYVLDGAAGGITTLACDPDSGLQWLETVRNQHTRGSRCLEVLPDGRTIVVANLNTHTLTVFARDPATGRLSLRQALPNGKDGVEQTKGQFGVTGSPDGKSIYVCSGLFGGDHSIAVFRVTDQGTLEQVQSFVNGQDELLFSGGRDAIVSPDGRNLYAVAKSGTLACFARDPLTGKIRLMEFFVNDPATNELKGPAAPECSPDGRFVYVPVGGNSGISIYRRELAR
jgi:6-phosphogluconolactonase (cycloisomerase 2 family)